MKLALLTTTAIIALSMTSTVKAEETSWFNSMKDSVQAWYAGGAQAPSEVEAYLDEVTIAVPPMTGEEAAAIQPAAGDYQETLEEAIENIPASIQDDQSFNTEFSNDSGAIAAFEDGISAEDLANIMPAAGDAMEITDEAVVVAEEAATDAMSETMDKMVEETQEQAADSAVETIQAESLTTQVSEQAEEAIADAMPAVTTETVTDTVTEAVTETETTMDSMKAMAEDKAEEMVKDAIEPATGDMTDTAVDAMKGMMQ